MHKKKAGKLQTGITFPKQYWLAVNGKPKTNCFHPVTYGGDMFAFVSEITHLVSKLFCGERVTESWNDLKCSYLYFFLI